MTFVIALALLAAPDSTAVHLRTLQTSTDAQELQWAVYHLARGEDSAAVSAIREFLADTARYLEPDADSLPSPQGTAAFYLGELGDTASIPALAMWLTTPGHEKTKVEAAAALVKLGKPLLAVPVLEYHALRDTTPPKNRTRTVNVFFLPGGEPVEFPDSTDLEHVAGMLRRITERGAPYLRARALEWLVSSDPGMEPDEALGIATWVMDSTRDEAARASAFRVLIALGTDDAEQRIEKAAFDWQPDIRFMADRYLAEPKRGEETGNQ